MKKSFIKITSLLLMTVYFSCSNKNEQFIQGIGHNVLYSIPNPTPKVENFISEKTTQDKKIKESNNIKPSPTPSPEKKLTLEQIYLLAEKNNKLEFFIKDDIQKTSDGKGFFIKYKSKDDEGVVIYKNDAEQAYWVHGDIYKSFIHSGSVQIMGYPVGEQEYLFEDKLKKVVARQKFENGRLFFFDDPNLDSFYESILVKKYAEQKIDNVNFTFQKQDFATYSQKVGGKEGDPVNVVIIAKDQAQLEKAFEDSKWVKPEFGFKNLPFSNLELFGRNQDLGYARETSNIFTFYKRRHHIRFWKADFKENDNEVWIAGATEDVEVKFKDKILKADEKANNSTDKKNPLTHKIDPDINKEVEYVKTTILEKNDKIKSFYIKHPKVQEAFLESLNGGNDLVLWDGRILILDITAL